MKARRLSATRRPLRRRARAPRLGRLPRIALLAALLALLAGCGGGGQKVPDLTRLPLVSGARIVQQVRACDRGANAFCALELVVVDPRYHNSLDLLNDEHARLQSLGWSSADSVIGGERTVDSPGHKLRVTFATPYGDLTGIDFGWIHRSRKTALTLAHEAFARAAALSMMLEYGPS